MLIGGTVLRNAIVDFRHKPLANLRGKVAAVAQRLDHSIDAITDSAGVLGHGHFALADDRTRVHYASEGIDQIKIARPALRCLPGRNGDRENGVVIANIGQPLKLRTHGALVSEIVAKGIVLLRILLSVPGRGNDARSLIRRGFGVALIDSLLRRGAGRRLARRATKDRRLRLNIESPNVVIGERGSGCHQ